MPLTRSQLADYMYHTGELETLSLFEFEMQDPRVDGRRTWWHVTEIPDLRSRDTVRIKVWRVSKQIYSPIWTKIVVRWDGESYECIRMKYLNRSLRSRSIHPHLCPDEFLDWLQEVRENGGV